MAVLILLLLWLLLIFSLSTVAERISASNSSSTFNVAVVLADFLVAVAVDFLIVYCSGGENISCPSRKENRSVLSLFL